MIPSLEELKITSKRLDNNFLFNEQPDYLTPEELVALLKAADIKYSNLRRSSIRNEFIRDRNKLFMVMLWATGGRISDVLGIREEEISYNKKTITFFVQKRKRWHEIFLDDDMISKISEYVQKWKIKGFLFKNAGSRRNEHISRQVADSFLKDYSKIAGIRPTSSRLFRHGLAMYLLTKGVPSEAISHRLNHSNSLTLAKMYGKSRVTPDIEKRFIDHLIPEPLRKPEVKTENQNVIFNGGNIQYRKADLSHEETPIICNKRDTTLDCFIPSNQKNGSESLNFEELPNINAPDNILQEKRLMGQILNNLAESFYLDLKFVDETDFENHLFIHLKNEYCQDGWEVKRQVKCEEDIIDITINNESFKVALELKIGHSKSYIRSSFGQVYSYTKHYPNTSLIVLDVGNIEPSYYKEFKEDLNLIGASLLVLRGKIRTLRHNGKS